MLVAYDIVQMRPGCVLLAAAMGASTAAAKAFPSESWLLAPTPDLTVYSCTTEELLALVEIALTSPQESIS